IRQRHGVADAFAQLLAGLEMRNMLAGKGNGIAGLRIATDAWRTIVQRETAKTADLDAIAVRQSAAHLLKHGLDGKIDVFRLEMRLAQSQRLDEFGFGHAGAVASVNRAITLKRSGPRPSLTFAGP